MSNFSSSPNHRYIRINYREGDTYEGEVLNSIATSSGESSPKRQVYQVKDGFGVYTKNDKKMGYEYVGYWKNDMKEGYGKCFYYNGDFYAG